MKALISPLEKVYSYDGIQIGFRVAQVIEQEFDVALPFFWADCPDNCVADEWYYNDGKIEMIPTPPTE